MFSGFIYIELKLSEINCANCMKISNGVICLHRGRTPEWYNKSYGHIAALHLSKIRNSFKHTTDGPESKV